MRTPVLLGLSVLFIATAPAHALLDQWGLNTLSFDFSGDTTGLTSIGAAVVPLPAAVWLFAGALAGLAGLRRSPRVAGDGAEA